MAPADNSQAMELRQRLHVEILDKLEMQRATLALEKENLKLREEILLRDMAEHAGTESFSSERQQQAGGGGTRPAAPATAMRQPQPVESSQFQPQTPVPHSRERPRRDPPSAGACYYGLPQSCSGNPCFVAWSDYLADDSRLHSSVALLG